MEKKDDNFASYRWEGGGRGIKWNTSGYLTS